MKKSDQLAQLRSRKANAKRKGHFGAASNLTRQIQDLDPLKAPKKRAAKKTAAKKTAAKKTAAKKTTAKKAAAKKS